MDIEFDPAKDRLNREKHGLSLAEAQRFEWETAFWQVDNRADYGETRYLAIGYIGQRLHVLVYTDRGKVRRVISLRKANSREEETYAKA